MSAAFPPPGRVALRRLARAAYPDAPDLLPDEALPELPGLAVGAAPNPVFRAVRQCLLDADLHADAQHTNTWNPFGALVPRGGRVLVLVNFVHQRLGARESREDFEAKCTQAAVLRPLLAYLCKAVGPEGRVVFGNAPVQGAAWPALLEDTGAARLLETLRREGTTPPVEAVDLRGWVLGEDRPRAEGVSVDLGADSLLEGADGNRDYRVLQYDPAGTARFHGPGRHTYRIAREALAADLIVSVPKLKTHAKVGVTGALKGCVGAIAEKDCLAHHRRGGAADGGDEYPAAHPLVRAASAVGDRVWQRGPVSPLTRAGRSLERALYTLTHRLGMPTGGSWPGNDTCWRMALDIARCLRFADRDGALCDTAQRRHVVLMDGVIGGEGNGPLRPRAVPSGCVLFAHDPFAADVVASAVMGFDPRRVRQVGRAVGLARYPVTDLGLDDVRPLVDGAEVVWPELPGRVCRRFAPPDAWRGAMEL